MKEVFQINSIDEAIIEKERQRTLLKLRDLIDENWIHEVGSTAVESVIGKQDLDFLIRTPKNNFEKTRDILDFAFERNPQQMSSDIYQGYTVESELDVALQLTIEGGPHDTFLAFLEALRNSPALREQYNELKKEFHGAPMTDYREAKRRFIETTLSSF